MMMTTRGVSTVDDKLTRMRSDSSRPSDADLRVENRETDWKRGFWMLIVTQFQGALNENGLKQLVVFLVLGMGLQQADRDRLVLVIGALFTIPFILFSMSGGFLADRFSKRTVTIGIKLFEVAVMMLAIAGLAWHNLNLEFAAVFLASTQSALFGPQSMDCFRRSCRMPSLMGQRNSRIGHIPGRHRGGGVGWNHGGSISGPPGMVRIYLSRLGNSRSCDQSGNKPRARSGPGEEFRG